MVHGVRLPIGDSVVGIMQVSHRTSKSSNKGVSGLEQIILEVGFISSTEMHNSEIPYPPTLTIRILDEPTTKVIPQGSIQKVLYINKPKCNLVN